jgi:probable phosphoglycerate mutase
MTRIYLIRHGENLDGQVEGRGPTVDLGLTEVGREQVSLLCHRLQAEASIQPTALLSSPERRAKETAEAIAGALKLPLRLDSTLEEWRSDDGSMPQEAFMAQWRALRDADRAYHRFQPQSETQAEFFARVGEALHRIARSHAGGSVLVVTHGGFIQAAFRHFFGFGDAAFRRAYPMSGHASLTLWREDAGTGRWALEFSNDRHHIERAT